MKRLSFRLLASVLTFFIGINTAKISFDNKRPPSQSQVKETAALASTEVETFLISDKNFEMIGDLPSIGEYGYNPIQFVNQQEGWYAADESLWRTQDGGETWKLVFDGGVETLCDNCNSTRPDSIKEFQFINSRVGWVLLQTKMYKTDDGGNSWRSFAQPLLSGLNGSVETFKFLPDGEHGWIAGGAYRPLKEGEAVPNRYYGLDGKEGKFGVIFSTSDGGETWRRQLLQSFGTIHDLYFLDARQGWATGTAGVYYLKNGKWKETITDVWNEDYGEVITGSLLVEIGLPTITPISLYFVNSQLGWLNNTDGWIGKSTDGGKTWKDLVNFRDYQSSSQNALSLHPSELYFSDAKNGWSLDSEGAVRRTYDGGTTWTKIDSDVPFSEMYFLDAHHGWVVAEKVLFRIKL